MPAAADGPSSGTDLLVAGPVPRAVPARLGAYAILKPLGRGGMGRVFLAEHVAMRRRVALKVLPDEASDDVSALERFYREARALAVVDHPNVVRAYDVREADGYHFLVMEFVPGKDLGQLLRERGRLPIGDAVRYAIQAAAGLGHAHSLGLIHRDVKPANLLVDSVGTVKVLDLGLARFHGDRDDKLTDELDAGAVRCTPDFVAPEQARGSTVDHRADIYSLGATLHTLLTGRPPFEGSITHKLVSHQARKARPVHEVRKDVPSELSAVVTRLMAKDPANRIGSMEDAMAALEPWKNYVPVGDTGRHRATMPALDWAEITSPRKSATKNVVAENAWKLLQAIVILAVAGVLSFGITWALKRHRAAEAIQQQASEGR